MSVPRPKKKRHVALLVMAIIIVLFMVAEGVVLLIAFTSPSGSKSISNDIAKAQRAWQGTKESPGIKQRAGDALSSFYEDQVRSLWAAPSPAPAATTFTKCAACHQDYETKIRFPDVYMNHPEHAQAGLSCATCHTNVQHPNPPAPAEAVCAKCHPQVSQAKQCDFCHPPGSLPHFYLLGYPRTQAVDCSTCHPAGTFPQTKAHRLVHPGVFNGSQKSICLQCHEYQHSASFGLPACLDCHSQQHPADWLNTHGSEGNITTGGYTECASCHTNSVWCAMQCHPYRSPTPKYPLPTEVPSP